MGAAEELTFNTGQTIVQLRPGQWVTKRVIQATHGYTEDNLKKYRSQHWLEGKHFKRNPANTIVYNSQAIDEWAGGKL